MNQASKHLLFQPEIKNGSIMNRISEIARREIRSLFYSPVGWLVLIVFTIQLGSLFSANISRRTVSVWLQEDILSLTYNMFFSYGGIISGMAGNLYLYIPLLTMGLLSREFSDGTVKLLWSSPVRVKDIVLGKYFSMMAFAGVMVAIVGALGAVLGAFVIKSMDVQLLLVSLLLLYLLICTYAAIGLFVSSLTSYPFVAALGTVGVLFGLNYLSRLKVNGMPGFLAAILEWFRGISFLNSFKGYVGSWDIFYFLLLIALFLGLTFVRLRSMRETKPWWVRATRYAMVIAIVVICGYFSSRPEVRYYADVRRADLTDTSLLIKRQDVPHWRMVFMQLIPGGLIAFAVVRVVRRLRS
jgi:ABC-2 type transport system permease protein